VGKWTYQIEDPILDVDRAELAIPVADRYLADTQLFNLRKTIITLHINNLVIIEFTFRLQSLDLLTRITPACYEYLAFLVCHAAPIRKGRDLPSLLLFPR
jgi:hypothetical protein